MPAPRTTRPALVRPMNADEEADPDRDRLLQLERDRAHDLLAQADEHEDRDREPLDHDQPHRLGEAETLAGDEREGDEGVQAEARARSRRRGS